ncbi:hypothetical protein EU545_01585 [Candidatus Thorarchaeota archaeon]|nr:MAG: hypothetical protein EU545_01585 [Candidatus Thorarchaeota archaeon]
METSDCREMEKKANERAADGNNSEAFELFVEAGKCWKRWESFAKTADCFERAYEHGMLAQKYTKAAEILKEAGNSWIKLGEHDKFELDHQIASEAYILAAEKEKDPNRLLDGAYSAILGGDLELARQLIHASAETIRGGAKELINLALMLAEYQFGDADHYIDAAVARVIDKGRFSEVREIFRLVFIGFVRTTLESELAVSLSSLAESTGLEMERIKSMVFKALERGLIPAHFDRSSEELVIDTNRTDLSDVRRRQRPILSTDLEDPGAWDIDLDEED